MFEKYGVNTISVEEGSLRPQINKAVFGGTGINYIGPIKSGDGYIVVEVIKRLPKGSYLSLDEVYDHIYLVIQKRKAAIQSAAIIDSLKQEYLYDLKKEKDQNNKISHSINLNKNGKGNDFEKIIRKENKEILNLLDFLSSIENSIFASMTGSGSCCYVVFENKHNAKKAFDIIEE